MAEPDRSSPSTSSSAAAVSSSSTSLYPNSSPAPEREEEQSYNHNYFDHEHPDGRNWTCKTLAFCMKEASLVLVMHHRPMLSVIHGLVSSLPSPFGFLDTGSDNWQVRVYYELRWLSYVVGICGMTMIMFVAFNFLNKLLCVREGGIGFQYGDVESAGAPLLSHNDDLSSWGSSYDSISNDEGDLEEFFTASSLEGKSSRDGEDSNHTWRLCAICFDAPRDCFFLRCGHCVAYFECGTRIAEVAGTCPVCRRKMKKVRKIFTV